MFGLGIHYLNGWAMAAADGAAKARVEWPPHPDRVFMALAAAWFETGQDEKEKVAIEWLEQLPPPEIAASEAEIRHGFGFQSPCTCYVPVNDDPTKKKKNKLLPEHRHRQSRKFPVAVPHDPLVYLVWPENEPETHLEALHNLCRKVTRIGHSASLVQMWVTDHPPSANRVPVARGGKWKLRVFGPGRLQYLERVYNKEAVFRYAFLDHQETLLKQRVKDLENQRKDQARGLTGKEKKQVMDRFRSLIAPEKEKLDAVLAEKAGFGQTKPVSMRPVSGLWQSYDCKSDWEPEAIAGSLFDPRLVILKLDRRQFDLIATLKLTSTLRKALISACPEPVPEWVSGHTAHGKPTRNPHLAFLPLAFVEHPHADGRIMGLALAVPKNLDAEEVAWVLDDWLRDEYGLPETVRLFNGKWLECDLRLETRETPPWSLQAQAWVRPSRIWASVTPVVLDRHAKGKDKWGQCRQIIKDACQRIGLPRPLDVTLSPVSTFVGVPSSRQFPQIQRKQDRGRMYHIHATLEFGEKVAGPVIVGAGRFRGYGLFRPWSGKEVPHA